MAAAALRASSQRGARPPAPHHPAGCSRRIRRTVEDRTGSFASPGWSPWNDWRLNCALAQRTDSWTDTGRTTGRSRCAAARPRSNMRRPTSPTTALARGLIVWTATLTQRQCFDSINFNPHNPETRACTRAHAPQSPDNSHALHLLAPTDTTAAQEAHTSSRARAQGTDMLTTFYDCHMRAHTRSRT